MSKEIELLNALLNDEKVEDFTPRSRMEAYLKNCCLACGCDGLPEPITETDKLLFALAEKVAEGSGGSGGGVVNICESTNPTKELVSGFSQVGKIRFPNAESIGERAFYGCTALTSVDLPVATSIGDDAFGNCTSLTSIDLPAATSIGNDAFWECPNFSTLILRNSETVCQLIVSAVLGTKIATAEGAPTGEGFIYVPTALYEGYVELIAYQAAMLLVSQGMGEAEAQATAEYIARAVLRKIEDYPEICG